MESPPPLRREDYPNINFWTKRQWTESSSNTLTDVHAGPQSRGRARAAQGINVTMRYVELEDGTEIGGDRAGEIRKFARSIWVSFAKKGPPPTKWGKADIEMRKAYCREVARRFPELRFCELDWKADQIATDSYPSWYVNWLPKGEVGQMKQEDGETASLDSGAHGKRSRKALIKPATKKSKTGKVTGHDVDNMQVDPGFDIVPNLQVRISYFMLKRLLFNISIVGFRYEYQPLDDQSSVLSYSCYCLLTLQLTQDIIMGSSILDTPANSGLSLASTVIHLSTQGITPESGFTADELPGIAPTMHTGSPSYASPGTALTAPSDSTRYASPGTAPTASSESNGYTSPDTAPTAPHESTLYASPDTALIAPSQSAGYTSPDTAPTAPNESTLYASLDTALTARSQSTGYASPNTASTAPKESTGYASPDTALTAPSQSIEYASPDNVSSGSTPSPPIILKGNSPVEGLISTNPTVPSGFRVRHSTISSDLVLNVN